MTKTVLTFTQASWHIIKRLATRTFTLAFLTIVGFFVMDAMIESGMQDRLGLIRRFPDLIPLMVAAAKFTFIEMSLLWIRIAVQPKVDAQFAIAHHELSSRDAVLMHGVNSLVWAFRVGVFIYLMG
jgi:hypothetical protein